MTEQTLFVLQLAQGKVGFAGIFMASLSKGTNLVGVGGITGVNKKDP
jgi:hypothetical protein